MLFFLFSQWHRPDRLASHESVSSSLDWEFAREEGRGPWERARGWGLGLVNNNRWTSGCVRFVGGSLAEVISILWQRFTTLPVFRVFAFITGTVRRISKGTKKNAAILKRRKATGSPPAVALQWKTASTVKYPCLYFLSYLGTRLS